MVSTRMQKTSHKVRKQLPLNVVRWLTPNGTWGAIKYLDRFGYDFRTIKSNQGYWLNVKWPCGITAGLTYRELEQLQQKETKMSKTKVDPRVRMKEVRAEVKMYANKTANPLGINNLGDLPTNMADARRVIIALQDMLEDSKQRHNKASDHVLELKTVIEKSAVQSFDTGLRHSIKYAEYITKQKLLNIEIEELKVEKDRLDKGWAAANERNLYANQDIMALRKKLDAAMTTLKTSLGA